MYQESVNPVIKLFKKYSIVNNISDKEIGGKKTDGRLSLAYSRIELQEYTYISKHVYSTLTTLRNGKQKWIWCADKHIRLPFAVSKPFRVVRSSWGFRSVAIGISTKPLDWTLKNRA